MVWLALTCTLDLPALCSLPFPELEPGSPLSPAVSPEPQSGLRGAGSDCEQMLAILNPLFNSLRQLFPIPTVGGIRIKFIPELNTHTYTRTPCHHLEAKLVSI